MKTMGIRDLRRRWPEAVATLVKVQAAGAARPRWDAAEHARWQKKVAAGEISSSDATMAKSRTERVLRGKGK